MSCYPTPSPLDGLEEMPLGAAFLTAATMGVASAQRVTMRSQILAAMCGHVTEVPIGIGPPLGRKTKIKTKIKYDLVPTAGQSSPPPTRGGANLLIRRARAQPFCQFRPPPPPRAMATAFFCPTTTTSRFPPGDAGVESRFVPMTITVWTQPSEPLIF